MFIVWLPAAARRVLLFIVVGAPRLCRQSRDDQKGWRREEEDGEGEEEEQDAEEEEEAEGGSVWCGLACGPMRGQRVKVLPKAKRNAQKSTRAQKA